MSRNVLYFVIGVIFIFLMLILFGRRGTATQEGFISPTPEQGSINSEIPPTVEVTPSVSVTSVPSVVTPTTQFQVTTAPTTSPAVTP